MEEEKPKICPNCKRDIPASNYMTHQVHCARNIKVCPVCKEPVPHSELKDHHEKMHKLSPCKQCGESICGTDLEDHIRDSCAHTVKSCRYCELELPRRELPAHEGYCGVRTEQCRECREWVMIKYRQLHLDSNHGFLRLNDDPVPKPIIPSPSTSNGHIRSQYVEKPSNINRMKTNLLHNSTAPTEQRQPSSSDEVSSSTPSSDETLRLRLPEPANGVLPKAPLKRTNDQPQINTAVTSVNKVEKDLSYRGAMKKRQAPQPPVTPPANPFRDLPYYRARSRRQLEENQRRLQNAANLAAGLPPVLTPAQKIDILRKMDALHDREVGDVDYKNRLQGRVWGHPQAVPVGRTLGSQPSPSPSNQAASSSRNIPVMPTSNIVNNPEQFRNLKPMSVEQFRDRFKELQLQNERKEREIWLQRKREESIAQSSAPNVLGRDSSNGLEWRAASREQDIRRQLERDNVRRDRNDNDRIGEIKSSLSQLRRGLNQIITGAGDYNEASNIPPPARQDSEDMLGSGVVRLPCEFCGVAVPLDELVQHQTGCRPDLAQLRVRSVSPPRMHARPPAPAAALAVAAPLDPDFPVIPCEFCTQPLPVYLLTDHQERCGRLNNLKYPK